MPCRSGIESLHRCSAHSYCLDLYARMAALRFLRLAPVFAEYFLDPLGVEARFMNEPSLGRIEIQREALFGRIRVILERLTRG